MTSEEALNAVKHVAKLGHIVLSTHGRQRARERGATAMDIKRALMTATMAIQESGQDKWRFEGGSDYDDEKLTVVGCFIQPGLLVVTMY